VRDAATSAARSLTTKYALPTVIGTVAAKQVHLNLLKIKQINQFM